MTKPPAYTPQSTVIIQTSTLFSLLTLRWSQFSVLAESQYLTQGLGVWGLGSRVQGIGRQRVQASAMLTFDSKDLQL